jgi:hypothetical protein
MVALLRDTFDAYTDFLADFWQDPMTKRIRALLAVRRESITWRRTCQANVPAAYWSYLERYPHGAHAADAGRLLSRLGAAVALPSKFARLDYDVPPPLPDELEYIERPTLNLGDPALAFEPPPPTPAYFLQPPPPEFADLKLPAASSGGHALPLATLKPSQLPVGSPDDVMATPKSHASDNAGGKPATKSAVDVATEPEKQASSPTSSPQGADSTANALADAVSSPPAAGAMATQLKDAGTPPLTVNQVTTEESKLPMAPSSSAWALTPRWLPDVAKPANQGIAAQTLSSVSERSMTLPTILAPPAIDATIQTWSYGLPSSPATAAVPQGTANPAQPVQPHANLPQPNNPASTAAAQSTGSIAPSTSRSGTLQSPATRSRSGPADSSAATPVPTGGMGQTKRPKKPSRAKPLPSTEVVRAPQQTPEESPPKP